MRSKDILAQMLDGEADPNELMILPLSQRSIRPSVILGEEVKSLCESKHL
jgi:hypothetical protein